MSEAYKKHPGTQYIHRDEKQTKSLPELYGNKENCCGCSACYAICPMNAILMISDEEGFLYPVVDAEKCVYCYQCLEVCAFKKDQEDKGYLSHL